MNEKISRALTFEEMHEATLKGERGNFNLDQAIQTMLEYKSRGESVSYRFNGFKLESDEISMDDIERIHEEYGKALSTKLPRELYAEEMRDAALKGERGNFNLEQAAKAMLEYKAKGESVYYVFNGFELNSDEITTVEETIEKYDRFLRRDREPQKAMDTAEEIVKSDLSDKRISRALTFEEMHEATLKGERGNFNLDQAIQTMLEYKARGESVSYRFNGFKLESDEISMDDIERIHEEYGKALSTKLPRELYAEEMRDAALKGERGNFNLEQAVQAMLGYKAKGESVYYVFNGFELNSDEITTVEETIEKYDRFLKRDREPQKTMDTPEGMVKNEEIDSEGIIPIDESKFAQIYGKAKGRIKEVFSKIKSFLNIKSNDRSDKTNDENIK